MALFPPLDATPDEIREALRPLRNRVSVAVTSAGNAFATGAIIRVAHSFLVREILLVGSEPHYEKASMGMEKLEDVVRLEDEDALLARVAGRPVYALERERATRSLYEIPRFPDDAVFVFGSERFGLSPRLVERADVVLGIPMYGVNHSLPLAVAFGITMSWWAETRYRGALV